MLLLHNDFWELSCEFCTAINANIQLACIKFIDNHAKKMSLTKFSYLSSSDRVGVTNFDSLYSILHILTQLSRIL